MAQQVQFLGHDINSDGIRSGKNKTKVIEEYPKPTSTKEVRQFLEVTGYFRKFVKEYCILARPLTMLLKKNVEFVWNKEQNDAFEKLKAMIITKPVLVMYDATKTHEVHTDASSIGLSGVLLQNDNDADWKPVFYFSRQCNEAERNYASHELEVLAIVETLQRYRLYLIGQKFNVITDCNAIAVTKATTPLLPRVARWWLKLQEFDFKCIHRAGAKNTLADGLSRSPTFPPTESITVAESVYRVVNIDNDWVSAMQIQDETLKEIIEVLNGEKTFNERQLKDDYTLQGQRLYRKVNGNKLLVVPKGVKWRLTRACHDEAGHFGLDKTCERLSKDFWFARMRPYVKSYIASCPECCINKVTGGKKEAQLHVSKVVPIPFRCVHIDHLGPFVRSKHGNCYILVIVCAFTKYVVIRALRNTKTTPVLAALRDYMTIYGCPTQMVSDRGTAFTSKEFQNFVERYDIRHTKVAVRTPRANGQAERINKTILASLKCSTKSDKEWDEALPQLQWCLNSQNNTTTKQSPNSIVFTYKLRDVTTNRLIQAVQDERDEDTYQHEDFRMKAVAERIDAERAKWKQRFDSKHQTPRQYNEGDLVVVDYVPQPTGTSHKLDPSFKGPCMVTKVLPNDRYVVEDLPDTTTRRKPYAGVFTNENMKPWCIQGLVDDDFDDEKSGPDINRNHIDDNDRRESSGDTIHQERPSCQQQVASLVSTTSGKAEE